MILFFKYVVLEMNFVIIPFVFIFFIFFLFFFAESMRLIAFLELYPLHL